MKLSECTHGKVVKCLGEDRIGMIVGISNNRPLSSYTDRKGADYAIPLVQWSDGDTTVIHHANIELYEG